MIVGNARNIKAISHKKTDKIGVLWIVKPALHDPQQAGAIPYERTDARRRIGTATRTDPLRPGAGRRSSRSPRSREFPFEAQVFGRYARVEEALVNVIVESYLQSVLTREIQEILAHLSIDLSLRLRFPGWLRTSTFRFRHSSCGRSNRHSHTSS